jgi:hypothetical protein
MKLKFLFQPLLCLLLVALIFVVIGHHKQERLMTFFNKCTNYLLARTFSPLTGNIKIVGRQLIVDGKPFAMKGVCYNPVRKGCTQPLGLITQNPTAEDLALIEKDFQMMQEAGVNTIRTYEPLLDQRILDLLVKYHLRTIVPVLNYHLAPFQKVTSIVTLLKNHPSTLIWEVGNEWNANYFYSKNVDPAAPDGIGFQGSFNLLKSSARYIKLLDTKHPVSTVLTGRALKNESLLAMLLHLKSVDLFGLNIYDGLSFGNRFQQWASHSTKPLYIGEFGADAFNANIDAEDTASQEVATRSLVTEILNNLSALDPHHVLVGGSIFEWNDEWWKDPKGSPETHDNGGITEPGEGPYPDYVFNEEWWGVLDIDRHPRPAYFTIKELYSKK